MLDHKFVPQFNITLRCNMYGICGYCYVKEQQSSLPLDMECEDFENILGWFTELGVDEIILLGGEPVLNPAFEEFIDIAGRREVSVRLFTNGTYKKETADLLARSADIETMFFHYDEKCMRIFDSMRENFLRNLEQASRSDKKVWLRWNIDTPDADIPEFIDLAERNSANVGYSISVPAPGCRQIPLSEVRQYADCLVRLVECADERGIRTEPARAMPLCQFDSQQLDFLKEKGNLRGTCTAINDLTINTDTSLQLCSVSHPVKTTRVSGLDDLRKKIDLLKGEESKIRSKPTIPECSECDLFSNGQCQGGCYGYKLYGE